MSNSNAKLQWLKTLSKLGPKQQCSVLKSGKTSLIKDLHKIVKFIRKGKNLKLRPKQKNLFKRNKKFLTQLVGARGVKKLRKILLRQTKGGGLILGALLPTLISLAAEYIPKLLGV
jgi:ATP-dependent protease Clp ATPase subunit